MLRLQIPSALRARWPLTCNVRPLSMRRCYVFPDAVLIGETDSVKPPL